MKFKKGISLILFLIGFQTLFGQNGATVAHKELQSLIGKWEGTITYLDYKSNKPFVMPAELKILRLENSDSYIFSHTYPQEPKANENDTITISQNRRLINNELIKTKKRHFNGSLEIVTEYLATDGNENKPAIIRHTYTIANKIFISRKDVQFALEGEWIKRSEYAYEKK